MSVRVGSINISGGLNKKVGKLRKLMRREHLDLLIVQETWRIPGDIELGMNNLLLGEGIGALARNGRGTGGQAILVLPEKRNRCGMVQASKDGRWIKTTYRTEEGTTWNIMGVYMEPSLPFNDGVMDEICLQMKGQDIVIGDVNCKFGYYFNDEEIHPVQRVEMLNRYLDTHNLIHLRPDFGNSLTFTFKKGEHLSFIDHCFVSNNKFSMRVANAGKFLNGPRSYHNLIICEDHFLESKTGSFNRSFFNDPKAMTALSDFVYSRFMTHADEYNKILAGATAEFKLKNPVSDCIDSLWAIISGIYADVLDSYVQRYDQRVVGTRRIADDSLSEVATKDITLRIGSLYAKTLRNDNKLSDSDGVAIPVVEIRNKYTKVFDADGEVLELWEPPTLEGEDWSQLIFNTSFVIRLAGRCKKRKASGHDNIPAEFFAGLNAKGILPLRLFFQACWNFGRTPKDWNTCTVSLIPKNNCPGDYRPISLILIARKIFEKGIEFYLRGDGYKKETALSAAQSGFRPKLSCYPNIFRLHTELEAYAMTPCFVDISMAYDTVVISKLMEKLIARGLPCRMINILYSLFWGGISDFHFPSGESFSVRRTRGLAQGAPLSPLLFDLYIDDLATALENTKLKSERWTSFFFADDIAIVAKCPSLLQRRVDICGNWARENGMAFGIKKCGHFSSIDIVLGDQLVPQVPHYKYLGIWFNPTGIDFLKTGEAAVKSMKSSLAMALRLGISRKAVIYRPWHRVMWYLTFVRSVVEYFLPIFRLATAAVRKKFCSEFDAVQVAALRHISGCRKAAHAQLRSLYGLPSFGERLEELTFSIGAHLVRVHKTRSIGNCLDISDRLLEGNLVYESSRRVNLANSKSTEEALKSWKAQRDYGVIGRLVENRDDSSHYDPVLLIRSQRIRRAAFWQRLNYYVLRSCKVCEEEVQLTRGHVDRCIRSHYPDITANVPYHILDFLLNKGKYRLFRRLYCQFIGIDV
jgi:hypothetical protein